jgi:hypothetical protein
MQKSNVILSLICASNLIFSMERPTTPQNLADFGMVQNGAHKSPGSHNNDGFSLKAPGSGALSDDWESAGVFDPELDTVFHGMNLGLDNIHVSQPSIFSPLGSCSSVITTTSESGSSRTSLSPHFANEERPVIQLQNYEATDTISAKRKSNEVFPDNNAAKKGPGWMRCLSPATLNVLCNQRCLFDNASSRRLFYNASSRGDKVFVLSGYPFPVARPNTPFVQVPIRKIYKVAKNKDKAAKPE